MSASEAGAEPASRPLERAAPGAKVTRLELFYDLVFVYAFLNVTTVTAERLGPAALLKSMLVLALLWFAWSTFAMLGNAVRTDEGIGPLLGFATMAAVFLIGVTIPEAFGDDDPNDLPGGLVVAGGYLLIRGLQVVAFWYASRGDPQLTRRWRRLTVPILVATAMLVLASLASPRLFEGGAQFAARVVLWVLAIGVEYGANFLNRAEGLTVVSVSHWAERHAQILLIAIGESIISLGIGPGLQFRLPLSWAILSAAALGIAVIAALWWAYFDALAIAAEQVLHGVHGTARLALARDGYTYLHLPMIAGVILLSLGLKEVLAVIAEDGTGALDLTHRYLLYGGVVLYFLALLAFQLRTVRSMDWFQVIPIVLSSALGVVPHRFPALLDLLMLAALTAGLQAVQTLRSRQPRRRLRRLKLEEQRALEAGETEWRRRHRGRWDPPEAG